MDKTILITGASGGIGRAAALKLAAGGWNVVLQYHRNERAAAVLAKEVRRLGRHAALVQADLAQKADISRLIEASNGASALLFAAGASQYGLLQDVTDEEMDALWHVQVKAPMIISRELISSLLKKPDTSITFVSSIWGETGASCETVYSAVKGAQIAFAKALAKELGPSGIRVNAIAPGAVDTPMNSGFSAEEQKAIASDIPLGRFADPDEIAAAAAFLTSKEASYITGQVLSVNGGWHT